MALAHSKSSTLFNYHNTHLHPETSTVDRTADVWEVRDGFLGGFDHAPP